MNAGMPPLEDGAILISDARQNHLKNLSSICTKNMEGHIRMLWKMKQELGQ